MQKRLSFFRYLCPLLILLLAPASGRGEGFVDFAIGGASTEDSEISFDDGFGDGSRDVEFDESFATGVRGGYWFEGLPWLGVGGMVSFFEADAESRFDEDLSIFVVPVTALLMLRVPLIPSDAVPHGHLQPYFNIGPGAFITDVDEHDFEGTDVDVGLDLHAGVNWMFNSRFGMFGEYRFTHYEANVENDEDFFEGAEIDSTLDTHYFLTGFAWHFD